MVKFKGTLRLQKPDYDHEDIVDSLCVYMYMNARKPDLNDIRYMVNEFMRKHFNDTFYVKDITHLTSITGTLTLENLD